MIIKITKEERKGLLDILLLLKPDSYDSIFKVKSIKDKLSLYDANTDDVDLNDSEMECINKLILQNKYYPVSILHNIFKSLGILPTKDDTKSVDIKLSIWEKVFILTNLLLYQQYTPEDLIWINKYISLFLFSENQAKEINYRIINKNQAIWDKDKTNTYLIKFSIQFTMFIKEVLSNLLSDKKILYNDNLYNLIVKLDGVFDEK